MSQGVTVLIAYDGSPHADAAIDQAATLFPGAQAFVATAWRSIRPAAGAAHLALPQEMIAEAIGNLDGAAEAEAIEAAAAGAVRAEAAGLRATPLTVAAEPNTWVGLLAAAEENAADVIAVGSRGRSAVSSALLGSVSNALVHNADRPVLVVRAASDG